MGTLLMWTGITVWVALPLATNFKQAPMAGAILMVVGCILMWIEFAKSRP